MWRAHARRDLFRRLCRREQGASITDLDVEVLNDAGRPWEVVVAGRQQPPLARLRGFGFVVNLEAVRQADLGAYDADAFWREGEGNPPRELRLAAVACAASGNVRGVPVQWLREADAIGQCNLIRCGIGNISAALLGLMLPAATSVRYLRCPSDNALCHRPQPAFPPLHRAHFRVSAPRHHSPSQLLLSVTASTGTRSAAIGAMAPTIQRASPNFLRGSRRAL